MNNDDLLYNNKYVNINSTSFSDALDRHKLSFQLFIKKRHKELDNIRKSKNITYKNMFSNEIKSINDQPKINNKFGKDDLQNTNFFNDNDNINNNDN